PGRAVEAGDPHVELLPGVQVDDDEVAVGGGLRVRAQRDVEADGGAAAVERAADVVERITVAGVHERAAPGEGVGEVGAAGVAGEGRLHHGRRVGIQRGRAADRLV